MDQKFFIVAPEYQNKTKKVSHTVLGNDNNEKNYKFNRV